jgi:hypothetical protein
VSYLNSFTSQLPGTKLCLLGVLAIDVMVIIGAVYLSRCDDAVRGCYRLTTCSYFLYYLAPSKNVTRSVGSRDRHHLIGSHFPTFTCVSFPQCEPA